MFPDQLIEHNRAFVAGREAAPLPPAEALPLAVVACYDPRLDELLRPALGLDDGEGFLLRAAGAGVDGGILRSLTLAVYLFDVRQVLVLGHSSCRMASFPTTDFVDAFRRRGVSREAFGAGDLRTWARAIPSPRQGVLESVAAIREAPFLPADLSVAGAVLDDASGRLELVFRPDEPTPAGAGPTVTATPAAAPRIAPPPAPPAEAPRPAEPAESPAAAEDPLAAIQEVIRRLGGERGLRGELAQLRLALGNETHPGRKVALVQQFVRTAATESEQVQAALTELGRAASAPRRIDMLISALLRDHTRSKP